MTVSINVNVDGLPIYNSTTKNFWPILCNIYEYPSIAPFTVGIYYGNGKPKDINQFMSPFIEELVNLLRLGVTINGYQLNLRIRCFICDTPARSFVKAVISFNGKYGCLKCTTKGRYSMLTRTMTYPELTAPLRTDEKFRSMEYSNHRRGQTPLMQLPIDMIQDIIVGDSLHLLELGVMKKLLTGWRTGSMTLKAKWSVTQKRRFLSTW
ncbi:AAEL003021-PA [Aedes aegypti]|uniref:AAEL003021-PA n=1 Tax=Aedes aegypti TaxID=7159 RepID=Q0IGC5_AEDAE|nr:AAEL003021-PA [Aedes aegypti]